MEKKQKRDRYEMHKYWGKKPPNDLQTLIVKYSKEGDVILDPFSGYGVFCCEAYLLNRNVISNDLNPIANFINRQLFQKDIDLSKLTQEWQIIRNSIMPYINKWFTFIFNGQDVHMVNILRNKDGVPLKARCEGESFKKTFEVELSQDYIDEFIKFENSYEITDWFPTDCLIENSRISAKKGMTVADLFTKRTLACHAKLYNLIERYSTGNEKEALKLAFTANLANCSKLVPPIKSRGDMSQGAWMTGFYVGETYLENNVLNYFENRLRKVIKGKEDYLKYFSNSIFNQFSNSYQITQFDAKKIELPDNTIDYIFTDPPYGDAVPYFEQSLIWNSWLSLSPKYEEEIVVSDSKVRTKTVINFEQEILLAISEIRRVLKPLKYFSLTYHSLCGLEWKAITNACILNGFELVDFAWLVQKSFTPRQLNRAKTVKGDVLATFRKAEISNYQRISDLDLKTLFTNEIENWLSIDKLDTNEIVMRIMNFIFERKIIIDQLDILDVLTESFTFTESGWCIK